MSNEIHINKIFQVSEFNEFLDLYIESVGEIVIEGEISQLNISQGKWIFITIKDKTSAVDIFGMTFNLSGYSILEEGMLVHVHGVPRIYKKSGQFRINATRIVPAGEGALKLAYEKLKLKLQKEGLFDIERKRPIPTFPEKIGLITARDSQAYKDFVKVLQERMGGIKIYYYPVQVQGNESVSSIVQALEYFNSDEAPKLDALVLTRGGGSLEDLISFNDESVARAVFASKVPVVCGIGHEGDVSLVDLVADLRASTPSNAAELISKERTEIIKQVDFAIQTIEWHLNSQLAEAQDNVNKLLDRIEVEIKSQLEEINNLVVRFQNQLAIFQLNIKQFDTEIDSEIKKIEQFFKLKINGEKQRLEAMSRLLNSLDHKNVLKRGFSLTMDKNGKIIKDTSQVKVGQNIKTALYNGQIDSTVVNLE